MDAVLPMSAIMTLVPALRACPSAIYIAALSAQRSGGGDDEAGAEGGHLGAEWAVELDVESSRAE